MQHPLDHDRIAVIDIGDRMDLPVPEGMGGGADQHGLGVAFEVRYLLLEPPRAAQIVMIERRDVKSAALVECAISRADDAEIAVIANDLQSRIGIGS